MQPKTLMSAEAKKLLYQYSIFSLALSLGEVIMLQISFIILFRISLKIPSLCSLLFLNFIMLTFNLFISVKALNSGRYKFLKNVLSVIA